MTSLSNLSTLKFSQISFTAPAPAPTTKLHSVLSFSNRSKTRFRRMKSTTSASISLSNSQSTTTFLESFRVDEKPATEAATIDEWMEDSVTGIVQNLKQAPLLVQVYSELNRRGSNSKFAYEFEKTAVRENWPIIRESTRRNGRDYSKKSPNGIIFVGELLDNESSGSNNVNNDDAGVKSKAAAAEEDGVTRAWGILVQGKGVKSGPTCYLLKTTRVEASSHFCLTKVTNFRETALKQLQNSWLLLN